MEEALPDLSLLVIRVADLDASKTVYERIGLRFETEQHGTGPEHLSSAFGGTVFELYPRVEERLAPVRLGFVVQNLDATHSNLEGWVVEDLDRGGTRVVVAADPDGNKIELTERSPEVSISPTTSERRRAGGR